MEQYSIFLGGKAVSVCMTDSSPIYQPNYPLSEKQIIVQKYFNLNNFELEDIIDEIIKVTHSL